MAQDTTPALVLYVGNGVQTEFEVPFDKGSFGEIKVAFVRRGLTDYTYDPGTYNVKGYLYAWNGGVYTKTETPDTDTPLYDKDGVATGDTWEDTMYREPKNDIFTRAYIEWTGEPLTSNDVICIVRETQKDQPYSYPNNQKHIERALDNLSRQIQELQLTADNALKVDPSWNYTMDDERKMDPIVWLQTIVRSKGLTLRELRIDNDYIEYTTDDPDSETKTWNVIAGVKTGNGGVVSHIRETRVLAEDGITWIPYLEYSVDGGNSWKPAGQGQSEMEHQYVKKAGDTMTGALGFTNGTSAQDISIEHYPSSSAIVLGLPSALSNGVIFDLSSFGSVSPRRNGVMSLGYSSGKWDKVYALSLNNGYDIAIPVTAQADTLALKSEVDLAANSGSQLRDKGVWYAKMDAATTPPSSAGVEGRNYADFTQVDGNGDPIIVIYTYTSGAWTQTETITPPASYNGYLPITSKFWDIQEQTGQQGGLVLWSYSAKTFTPYPRIISTDSIAITNSTFSNGTLTNVITTMPDSPVAKTVTNKQYVDNAIAAALAGYDTPELFDWKWRDATTSKTTWKLSDGNWINKADAETAYAHLAHDAQAAASQISYPVVELSGGSPRGAFVRAAQFDETGADYPYAYANVTNGVLTLRYSTSDTGASDVIYYNGSSTGSLGWSVDISGTTLMQTTQFETIAGTTVMYWLASDGHKIVVPQWRPSIEYSDIVSGQDTAVAAIYTATGTAWYYLLNMALQKFKLPRALPFTGAVVGNGMTLGLTNGTGGGALYQAVNNPAGISTSFYGQAAGTSISGSTDIGGHFGLTSDATKSGVVAERGATDQYKYLYFYVGQ